MVPRAVEANVFVGFQGLGKASMAEQSDEATA